MSEEFECEHLEIFCVKRRIGSGHCTSPDKCVKADEIASKKTIAAMEQKIQELEARERELVEVLAGLRTAHDFMSDAGCDAASSWFVELMPRVREAIAAIDPNPNLPRHQAEQAVVREAKNLIAAIDLTGLEIGYMLRDEINNLKAIEEGEANANG